jgi:hypothetical protein
MWKSYPRPFWPGVLSPHLLAGERGCKRAAGEWGPGVWGSPCTRRTYRIPRAASLCPGFGQVGRHDRHPSRSGRADRRPSAPERRGPAVKAWAGVPCESRTRIARRDHRSHYTRRLRLDPTVPPRRSFLQRGARSIPPSDRSNPVSASARPGFPAPAVIPAKAGTQLTTRTEIHIRTRLSSLRSNSIPTPAVAWIPASAG